MRKAVYAPAAIPPAVVKMGPIVVETHTFRVGHEITLIERFRLSEDGKTLSYTQEVSGPGRSTQHTIDFEVS